MKTPEGVDWQRPLSAQVAGHVTEEQFQRRAPAEDPEVRDVDSEAGNVRFVDGTDMSLSAYFGRQAAQRKVQRSFEVEKGNF